MSQTTATDEIEKLALEWGKQDGSDDWGTTKEAAAAGAIVTAGKAGFGPHLKIGNVV